MVFGPALDLARAFAGHAGYPGGRAGPDRAARSAPAVGPHRPNCAVVADLIDSKCRTLADIGSGAGLPGLVLAMMWPDLSVTLLEPMERRCRFLSECIAELGLANTSVLRGRAEETVLRADVATARAVAPLDRLAAWQCVSCVRAGWCSRSRAERPPTN